MVILKVNICSRNRHNILTESLQLDRKTTSVYALDTSFNKDTRKFWTLF